MNFIKPIIALSLLLLAPAALADPVCHIFYNNSSFDGNNPAADAADDAAIAADKSALTLGTAAFINYTSFTQGINGIMVDIPALPDSPSAADFAFRVGNDDDLGTWTAAPAPTSVTTRPGAGVDGADRVTIIFADNAIVNQWLEIKVLATVNTGLARDYSFYYGNAIGETGNSATDAVVDATDEINARNNPRHFMRPAAVDSPYDHDRDQKVDATDQIISRNNVTDFTNDLNLITIVGPAEALPLLNLKSGIDLTLSGTNGLDYAIERTYHDDSIADQILYVRDSVEFALAHNERNTICISGDVIGVDGNDGVPDSGDEGIIHYKIDRDMQSHRYNAGAIIPSWAPIYSAPFKFATLTYDGSMPILGAIGDNGGPFGSTPRNNPDFFAYGQADDFGNEWHTVTYWDDDQAVPNYSHGRAGASDGHCVFVCVNPQTPVIQLRADGDEQFYTTPVKTYHIPKIWDQTTYLTSGVTLSFINLTNASSVQYRVGGTGAWQTFAGQPIVASDLFAADATPYELQVKAGATGTVLTRTVIMNPGVPGASETHGLMLWADAAEKQATINRVRNTQPFRKSYDNFKGTYYQGMPYTPNDKRKRWRGGASMASQTWANAFKMLIDGTSVAEANIAKVRLERLARLQPVGNEGDVNVATPAKDFLNELSQTIQLYADAGLAYDLLAAHYRDTDHADGMTPIEELLIRDGLAKITKSMLQVRSNWSAISGSGDTHWAHGFELMIGIMAFSMPTYATPYYGVSGADLTSTNTFSEGGQYWNPFPDQGVTWYEICTDPAIATPGFPNIRYPFRSEFQVTEDGYWTGPNDLQGDGDRYYTGSNGRRLVDVKFGGMANAECRVELVEMHGYEAPFTERIYAFDQIRRIKGAIPSPRCIESYVNRRLIAGYIPLSWDAATMTYTAQEPRIERSIYAFNNHYNAAATTGAQTLVSEYLNHLNIYYGVTPGTLDPDDYDRIANNTRKTMYNAYALAMCMDPSEINAYTPEPNLPPVVKPLFKSIVKPNEQIKKEILAMDLNDDALTVTVNGLPAGATYNAVDRMITWTPGASDLGVYVVTVTADDGNATTSRPFVIGVKTDAGDGPYAAAPSNLTVAMNPANDAVELSWDAPSGESVAGYAVYRDGALWAVTDANTTTYTDSEWINSGQNTRYHVATYNTLGSESSAIGADPAILYTP